MGEGEGDRKQLGSWDNGGIVLRNCHGNTVMISASGHAGPRGSQVATLLCCLKKGSQVRFGHTMG